MSINGVRLSEATPEQIEEISNRIHALIGELYADQIGMKKPEIKIMERGKRNAS